MVHVGFLVSRLNKGGGNSQLFYICKFLNRSIFKFTIITLEPRKSKNTYHGELKEQGINIIELNYKSKIISIIRAKNDLIRIAEDFSIDIFQSYGFRAEFIIGRLSNFPKITTVRNRPMFNYRIIYGNLFGPILCRFHIYYTKKFDKIISCSTTVSKEIKKLKIYNDIVITDGVDLTSIVIKDKIFLKKTLALEVPNKIFITISSNKPGKNVEFLIKVFNKYFNEKNCELLVVGHIDNNVIKRYKNFKNIRLIGYVTNIFDYFQAADYFISASLSEGMPNAVLEAMACGLPVILSDIESHKEIFEKSDREIGILFKNNNEDDLVYKIKKILMMDYKSLSENSKLIISKFFDAREMSNQYQKVYLELKK